LARLARGAEELHLLANEHGRNASRRSRPSSPQAPAHEGSRFQIEASWYRWATLTGETCGKRPANRGEYQIVRFRFRARTQVVERMEKPEAGFSVTNDRPFIAHPTDGLRHPGRIAGEQLVVIRRA